MACAGSYLVVDIIWPSEFFAHRQRDVGARREECPPPEVPARLNYATVDIR